MASLHDVYNYSMAGIQAAYVDEEASFRKATMTGDTEEQVRASTEMARLRTLANEYHRMSAEQAANIRAATPQNKYGLNKDEIEVANGMFSSDQSMTNDERQRVYAEQRAKYRHMRATGEYRDDQGTVTR